MHVFQRGQPCGDNPRCQGESSSGEALADWSLPTLWALQSLSPKHTANPQRGVGDQAEHLSVASLESLDAMSEGDSPTAFTRGTRSRASLPVVRSANQTKDRSLGTAPHPRISCTFSFRYVTHLLIYLHD